MPNGTRRERVATALATKSVYELLNPLRGVVATLREEQICYRKANAEYAEDDV